MVDIEVMAIVGAVFIMGLAPFSALVWVKIADVTRASMQSGDETAAVEKVNPVLVPGTSTAQSSQSPATCPVK